MPISRTRRIRQRTPNGAKMRDAKRIERNLQHMSLLTKVTRLMRTFLDIPPETQWLTADRKPLKVAKPVPHRKGLLRKVRGI